MRSLDPEENDWGWTTFDKEKPFLNYFNKYCGLDGNEFTYWSGVIESFCYNAEQGDLLPFPNGFVAKISQQIDVDDIVWDDEYDMCGSCGMDFEKGESVYIARSGSNKHKECWHWDMRWFEKDPEYYKEELGKVTKVIWDVET